MGLIILCKTHPLILHLTTTKATFSKCNFLCVKKFNLEWAKQPPIDLDRQYALTAALFHFKLDASLLLWFQGNNYTEEYRNVTLTIKMLCKLKIEEWLISNHQRVMRTGWPSHFNAESSWDKALLYWGKLNGPTISKKLNKVEKTMNKEEKKSNHNTATRLAC